MKCQYEGCQEGHFCYGYHPAEWVQTLDGDGYWTQEDYEWGACPCCEGENFENCPKCTHLTKHAPDVVESAASVSISPASEVSVSEADSTPATKQVM